MMRIWDANKSDAANLEAWRQAQISEPRAWWGWTVQEFAEALLTAFALRAPEPSIVRPVPQHLIQLVPYEELWKGPQPYV